MEAHVKDFAQKMALVGGIALVLAATTGQMQVFGQMLVYVIFALAPVAAVYGLWLASPWSKKGS